MKKWMIICGVISLLLTVAMSACAAGEVSIAPVFGKITYRDSDSNGFSNATWIGINLTGEWELPQRLVLQFGYNYGSNDDAVGQDPQWQELDPDVTTDGKLTNRRQLFNLFYAMGNQRFGVGYFKNQFKVTEYGFTENRDYDGICLVGDLKLGKDGLTEVGVIYAPSLSVADHVRGDWNNPDRTAATDYDGSYWELTIERIFVIRDDFRLAGGFNYAVLSGDGADHTEYRFLKHDLTLKNFYVKARWQF